MEVHAARIQGDPSLTPVTWLCMSDVTDGHAVEGVKDGRALDADGKEVLILVVSSKFERKSILQRQRMVNTVLFEDLSSGILHSVRMRCLTPAQWEKKGKPMSFRPDAPCSISHNANLSFSPSTSTSFPSQGTDDGPPAYAKPWKKTVPSTVCACGDHRVQ